MLRRLFLELALQTKKVEPKKSLPFENQVKVNNIAAYKIKDDNFPGEFLTMLISKFKKIRQNSIQQHAILKRVNLGTAH